MPSPGVEEPPRLPPIILGAPIPRGLASGTALRQYWVLMMPCIATLPALVRAAIRQRDHGAPHALNLPFVREDRR